MPFLSQWSGGLFGLRAEQAIGTRNAAVLGLPAGGAADIYRASRQRPPAGEINLCGVAGCAGSSGRGWRTRRRSFFEGEWACSTRCLQILVRTAVRRQMQGLADDAATTPHRHRVPLGLVLLAQGWITHAQLQTALQAQRRGDAGRIGDCLIDAGAVTAEQVVRGLGIQWNCPVLSLEGFSAAAMALVMPPMLAAESGLMPVRTAGRGVLYVGFEKEMNASALLALERMSGLRVEGGLLLSSQLAAARESLQGTDCVPVHRALLPDVDAFSAAVVRLIEQRQPVSAKMVRMGDTYWLRLWLEAGARSGIGDLPAYKDDMEDHLLSVGRRIY